MQRFKLIKILEMFEGEFRDALTICYDRLFGYVSNATAITAENMRILRQAKKSTENLKKICARTEESIPQTQGSVDNNHGQVTSVRVWYSLR